MTIKREDIVSRIANLKSEKEKVTEQFKATVCLYDGAIQDGEYWLGEVDKPEPVPTPAPEPVHEDTPVQTEAVA